MEQEMPDFEVAYYIPSKYEGMDLYLRHTANAWWKDASKVYRLLDAFDNHRANIEEACGAAGISLRQYKYFANQHPFINKRRKISRYEMDPDKRMSLAMKVSTGDLKASMQWLRHSEPEFFDIRYRSSLSALKRIHKIPASPPPPKTQEQKDMDMRWNVEKHRREILGDDYETEENL